MITYDVLLDSHATGCQQIVRGFYRGEAGEKQLRITLMHPGVLYAFEPDADVVVFGKKPDGTCIVHACEIADGKAVYTPTTQTLAAVGSVQCQLVVYDTAGKILFTPEFCIEVAETVRDEQAVESSNDFLYLDALILKANENMQFLRDIPALTPGSNGTLLCDDALVGALVYAVDYRELPETPNGQLAYVQCDWDDRAAGFYLRIFDTWMHLPLPDAHRHKNKALLDALTDSHIHSHDNRDTLDLLSVRDDTLYLDGKPVGKDEIRIRRIGDDSSTVPTEPEGTLLYFVTGTDPDLLCYPLEERTAPDGTVYWYNPPWQAGQLWISSGLHWNLLYSHAWRENEQGGADPAVGDGTDYMAIVRALQKTAHTHGNADALARIGTDDAGGLTADGKTILTADTSETVLLPIGEPLKLMVRENFAEVPLYVMQTYMQQNDPRYDFYIEDTNGVRLRLVSDGIGTFGLMHGTTDKDTVRTADGIAWDGDAPDLSQFTIAGANGYTSADDMPQDILEAYRTFCSIVNTSADNMGAVTRKQGGVEIPTNQGMKWGRSYAVCLPFDSIYIAIAEDTYTTEEACSTIYVYFPNDVHAEISGVDCLIGAAPETTAGWHKWVLGRLPNGQVSLEAKTLQSAV